MGKCQTAKQNRGYHEMKIRQKGRLARKKWKRGFTLTNGWRRKGLKTEKVR